MIHRDFIIIIIIIIIIDDYVCRIWSIGMYLYLDK